jgi:nicotinamidase-related amidase
MPSSNADLHGNVPDASPVALLIIDMINDLEFPGGERLLDPAVEAARNIAALRERCTALRIPTIFANDNFGRWRSDFREAVSHVLGDGVRGEPLARQVTPGQDDYFILKPKHSAFFSTTLDTLLRYLGTRRLIVTGVRTDSCVLLTAADAYMRDYTLSVPRDCVAGYTAAESEAAMEYMTRVLEADPTPSTELRLPELVASVTRSGSGRRADAAEGGDRLS